MRPDMARPRAYRHDIRCARCGSNWMPKDGHSRGKQTYRCGHCNYRQTPGGNRGYHSQKVVGQAVEAYRQGMNVSAISRMMGISCVAVYGWIKKAREALAIVEMERERRNLPAADIPHSVRKIRGIDEKRPPAKVISFDEMWSYMGVRKGEMRQSAWIWTAVVEERDSSRWSDFEVGRRDLPTFWRLLRRLPDAEKYRSDEYEVYGCIPKGRHVWGKGSEVNRN